MPSVRVLVVDDFEPFRQLVSLALEKMPDLRVVGEASYGVEAVEHVKTLQPELVLLDIGLPGLNGLEVARQIRAATPSTTIVFLTQESSGEIVREALELGAKGYVVKTSAEIELPEAVRAVLEGQQFVSREIAMEI